MNRNEVSSFLKELLKVRTGRDTVHDSDSLTELIGSSISEHQAVADALNAYSTAHNGDYRVDLDTLQVKKTIKEIIEWLINGF